MAIKLNVPYRSQWDLREANDKDADCGPTCLAMILNFRGVAITPNRVYASIDAAKGKKDFTLFWELEEAARRNGVEMTRRSYQDYGRDIAFRNLRANLDAGNPGIALVTYLPWKTALGNNYTRGHFVVVTGYDEGHITMHDPLFGLNQIEKATHYRMSIDLFDAGWGATASADGNLNYGKNYTISYVGRVVDVDLGPVPQPHPTPPPVVPQPPPPVVTPTPQPPQPPTPPPPQPPTPTGKIMDDVNRRIRALAAYRWAEAPDLNNPAAVQIWRDNLSDFGLEYDEHRVVSGDTLSGLAARFYGQAHRWPAIKVYTQLPRDGLWLGDLLLIPRLGTGGAHANPALPADTADFSKDLEFLAINPEAEPLDYDALVGDNSIGIGYDK